MKTYYEKHRQVSLNKWYVYYKGQYRGTVKARNEYDALDYIPVERYPERNEIKLERIIVEE